MVKYPLKKLNNDNKDLVVGGLNSMVLSDCSPAERIETSSTLTFGTRATTTASSTLTPVTCNAEKHSSVRNNNLADRRHRNSMRLNKHNFPVRRGRGGQIQTEKSVPLRPWNLLQNHKHVVGINLDQMACQLALLAIAQNKRYMAGLHVAAGRFKLRTEALDDMTRRKEEQSRRRVRKRIRKLWIIKQHWTRCKRSELSTHGHTNGRWRKQKQSCCGTNELAMHHAFPPTKQLMLTEYVNTIRGGDAPVPVAVAILPPSASAAEDDEDEVVIGKVIYVLFAQ